MERKSGLLFCNLSICKLGEYKPENCRKYPYTDQPERLHSLYSV